MPQRWITCEDSLIIWGIGFVDDGGSDCGMTMRYLLITYWSLNIGKSVINTYLGYERSQLATEDAAEN